MNASTHALRLRLLMTLIGLLASGWAQLTAQDDHMTFTTQRNAAIKDWTADTCIVTKNAQILIIRGLTATGRTDIPYQELRMVVSNYTGPGDYSLNSSTYFEDIFQNQTVKTTFQSGSVTLTVDQTTGEFGGTFSMFLYSNPPGLPQFTTRIYNGVFGVTPTTIVLEAKTKRDTIQARAGDKGKLVKLIAKDEFGGLIKDVDLTTLNPLAGGAQALGKTDANGEFMYSFDVPASTVTDHYAIEFNASKARYAAGKVKKIVDVNSRYWIYKCGGVELLTFDAGDGNEWKSRQAPSTVLDATGGAVIIDKRLEFAGTMSIDPTANTVLYDGQIYVPNIPLPGGQNGNLELNTKRQGQLSLNCNTLLKWAIPEVCKVKLGGLTLSLEELEFVDLQIEDALKVKVKAELDGVSSDCSKSNSKTTASIAGTLVISPSGIQEWKIEATNGLFYNPYFCMNDLKVGYEAIPDKWTASVATQWSLFDPKTPTTIKGGFTVVKGVVDSIGAELKAGDLCIAVPNTPFCAFGAKASVSGISQGFTTTAGAISAGVYLKTDEAIVLQKFPWLKTMLGDPGLAEFVVEGKWSYPKKFSGATTWKLFKLTSVSVTKPWQVEVAGTADLDVDNELRVAPNNIKAFHFGADDYFVTASAGSAHFTWGNDLMVEYDLGGATLRLPDVPDDAVETYIRPFLKMMKGRGYLPAALGTGRAYASLSKNYGMKAEAYVDLSSNPIQLLKRLGRVSVKLECSDKTNAKMRFAIDAGATSLVSVGSVAHRKSDVGVQSAGRQLPGPFVAHALDTFTVQPNVEWMNIFIEGQSSTPPVAYLIAPNGVRYDATTSDSTIIIDQETPGDVRMLTVMKPAPGAWVLGLVNPKPSDSVTVLLPLPAQRSFAINATSASRTLTVTWDKTGLTSNDAVAVHLDNINDNGGALIGIARGDEGRFEYTFDDKLTDCSYKVHAVLSGDGNPPLTANASGEFSTGKTILAPPLDIAILSNAIGEATVTWNASPDPNTQAYLIYVRGVETHDSLLVVVPAYALMARVAADTALLRTLFIRSADHDGNVGCPSPAPSFAFLGVNDQSHASTGALTSGVSVAPNPVNGIANIKWQSEPSATTVVDVRNLLGETVAHFDLGRSEAGVREVQWNTDDVTDGVYVVVVHTGMRVRTAKVTVAR